MYKIKRLGQNLIIIKNQERPFTIVLPKDYNFDKIFSLAYRANEDIKVATALLEKEINKYIKAPEKNKEVLDKRIEKKKIEKKIKEIKSISLSELPIEITSEWKEILDSIQGDKTHIENMLIWLALNENKNTRDNFLKNFDAKYPYITKNGFICAIRAVWKDEIQDELYTFVQSKWKIVKAWKKSPKNYGVYSKEDKYLVSTIDPDKEGDNWDFEGNLNELYENYKPQGITTYVSNYSKNYLKRKDNWTIGSVAEIHEKATHTEICGMNQLHCLSNPKDAIGNKNGNFGDVYLLILVNPKDIINAELGYKFTTSRFYICAEITTEEIEEYFNSHWELFDYDYLNYDVKKLQEVAIKQVNKEKIDNLKEGLKSFKTIKTVTEQVLKNNSDHLPSDLYNKILDSRIQLLK